MKNINFHSLKNTPVPEELKQSVIDVSKNTGEKSKKYPVRMIRFAVAAAFLAVITAVSVPVLMNIGDDTIPVMPASKEGTQTPSGHTEKPSRIPTSETVAPTRPPSTGDRTSDTVSPTQQSARDAVPQSEPSDISYEPTQPVIGPEISTQAPTQPPAPTQAPTQPPTVAPTEAPIDKLPDLAPVGYDGIIIEDISADELGDDSIICCRIYTQDGEPVGDGDSYSEEHLARRIDRGEEVTVYYIPCDYVVLPYNGVYRYEFYDETGRILCTGSEYLMTENNN